MSSAMITGTAPTSIDSKTRMVEELMPWGHKINFERGVMSR
jgi:hypothetical protein